MGPLGARRAQHLVFLAHVWACTPFLVFWMRDLHVRHVLGAQRVGLLSPVIGLTIVYLAVRTWVAWKDFEKLRWQYFFSPIDVALITLILYLSQRGPMSNITLLYFLPMIQASASMNVRWAAAVGLMIVLGTVLSAFSAVEIPTEFVARSALALWREDPLNVTFRIYFLVVLSSLMAYQTLIGAGLKERLAVAADRNRIAMDMHDGVQGHLIQLASQLELIGRIAPGDGERAAMLAEEGRETARSAADELRFLVQRLRSPSLAGGFIAALRQYAHNICERQDLALRFEVTGEETAIEPDVENAVFRIAEEAVTNVVKHARAHQLTLRLGFAPKELSISIEDDGCGFLEGKPAPGAGVGLVSLAERAAKVGGKAEISSALGRGTIVTARFPLRPTLPIRQ